MSWYRMLAHANPVSYLLALHQPLMPLELPAFPLNVCLFVCNNEGAQRFNVPLGRLDVASNSCCCTYGRTIVLR
jgi:hypothetical protein